MRYPDGFREIELKDLPDICATCWDSVIDMDGIYHCMFKTKSKALENGVLVPWLGTCPAWEAVPGIPEISPVGGGV